MPFDASVLISDSRLAFLQGQYEVSLILAKEVLQKEPKNSDAQDVYKRQVESYSGFIHQIGTKHIFKIQGDTKSKNCFQLWVAFTTS